MFFARVAPYRKGRFVVVFDCDRDVINRGSIASDPWRDHAMTVMREHGGQVVDLCPSFRQFVGRTGRHLEVSPTDGHWNHEAVRLVAQNIVRALHDPWHGASP